ncbi:hypothetical protein MMC25_007092 [Agyrium rufum]|nr:hypothetical protein [Agyrium rufum]
MLRRPSLCLPSSQRGIAAHCDNPEFEAIVSRTYTREENNALHRLLKLKEKLGPASNDDFWVLLMEGLTEIAGSQYTFVAKRVLVDDQDSAVEMPPIGEPGSCLTAVAIYFDDGTDSPDKMSKNFNYTSYGNPCSHMKHDKVFMVPEDLPGFLLNNPVEFPIPIDAYLGVPLFADGKCFAHFGLMWTADGVKNRGLSWGFTELLLHSLEDVITRQLVEGQSFTQTNKSRPAVVIPQEAITTVQSLKPYARSLSHELRTPMQGVVGMLEIMHATVQESLEAYQGWDNSILEIFMTLRENIETVQDSSRRAVEAADNFVQASHMNMQVPETPDPESEDERLDRVTRVTAPRPPTPPPFTAQGRIHIQEATQPTPRGTKRPRDVTIDLESTSRAKYRALPQTTPRSASPRTMNIRSVVKESDTLARQSPRTHLSRRSDESISRASINSASMKQGGDGLEDNVTTPGVRATKVRELIQVVINESLRIGGRPESAIAEDTELGEILEIRTRNPQGEIAFKVVEWSVDIQVPEMIAIDERDLAKLISVVFLNAIKFTEKGVIRLEGTLSPKNRYLVLTITDTGTGIPQDFLPRLFRPFTQEDGSITRPNEGLGLGLLVAKGVARRIGGDLTCVRSSTEGPNRGSSFEIRVPLSPMESSNSRASTRSPTPSLGNIKLSTRPQTPVGPVFCLEDPSPKSSRRKSPIVNISRQPRSQSPLETSSPSRHNMLNNESTLSNRRPSTMKPIRFNRNLSKEYPLKILVAEDNHINRKLLVSMLGKLGYKSVLTAFDGAEAVRIMKDNWGSGGDGGIDMILMDLWMPHKDGYEATKEIQAFVQEKTAGMEGNSAAAPNTVDDDPKRGKQVKILAVTADITDEGLDRAKEVGMAGYMTKPYKLLDLERLIVEHCRA